MKSVPLDIPFRNQLLHGMLYLPSSSSSEYPPEASSSHVSHGYPLVIRLNGMPGLDPEFEQERLAPLLTAANFAFYTFDYQGVRKSSGVFDYNHALANINHVITTLARHPLVDPNRIFLFGESFGGAMAIAHAKRDPRVKALVLRSAVFDTQFILTLSHFDDLHKIWTRSKKMRFPPTRSNDEFRELFRAQTQYYNPRDLAPLLHLPVTLIVGDNDELLPLSGFSQLAKSIPYIQEHETYHVINGADHNFTNPSHVKKLAEIMISFLNSIPLSSSSPSSSSSSPSSPSSPSFSSFSPFFGPSLPSLLSSLSLSQLSSSEVR